MDQLNPNDTRSAVWKRLEKGLRDRLQELRESNDAPENTEQKTAQIRGRISEVKRILALSEDSARAEVTPSNGDDDS